MMATPGPSLGDWLKTRPTSVQALAAEFPLGSMVEGPDGPLHLIGYTESDMLIVSPVDPGEHYEHSLLERRYVCAAHYR